MVEEERFGLSEIGNKTAEELPLKIQQFLIILLQLNTAERLSRTAERVAMAARNASPSLSMSSSSSSSSFAVSGCLMPSIAAAAYLADVNNGYRILQLGSTIVL